MKSIKIKVTLIKTSIVKEEVEIPISSLRQDSEGFYEIDDITKEAFELIKMKTKDPEAKYEVDELQVTEHPENFYYWE